MCTWSSVYTRELERRRRGSDHTAFSQIWRPQSRSLLKDACIVRIPEVESWFRAARWRREGGTERPLVTYYLLMTFLLVCVEGGGVVFALLVMVEDINGFLCPKSAQSCSAAATARAVIKLCAPRGTPNVWFSATSTHFNNGVISFWQSIEG